MRSVAGRLPDTVSVVICIYLALFQIRQYEAIVTDTVISQYYLIHVNPCLPSPSIQQPLLKCNELCSVKHIGRLLLHLLKPHEPTRLAFQMLEKRSQRQEVLSTKAVRAMVDLRFVHERVKMRVETGDFSKLLVADVALPKRAVERVIGGQALGIFLVPSDQLFLVKTPFLSRSLTMRWIISRFRPVASEQEPVSRW